MSRKHVPYFETRKVRERIARHKTRPTDMSLERIHSALHDVQNEIDACLFDLAQYGRDIEIGYQVHVNRARYHDMDERITELEDLEQRLRDIVDPPTEYIAFAEYEGAFWAQRRLTQGCKSPRADDRIVSKAKRFETTDLRTFLETLEADGRTQPTYHVEPLSSQNPRRVALVH